MARRESDRLFVAVDTNADQLKPAAWRASRRPARGGTPNVLFFAASATELCRELPGVADRVTIILPWGDLLRAVAAPEEELLRAIGAVSRTGATFELVYSHDPRRDSDSTALPPYYDAPHGEVQSELRERYRCAGLLVHAVEALDQRALLSYPTTWAQRLGHGGPRKVWRVRGDKR